MWRHRAVMRDLIGGFLSGAPHDTTLSTVDGARSG
jgi:hypothetical protein